MNLPSDAPAAQLPDPETFDLADAWIFDQLNETIKAVKRLFDAYEFGEAGRHLYSFIWNDFCDWYIEIAKVDLNGDDEQRKAQKRQNLTWILDQILRLMHPIMPFVTEKLWLSMPHDGTSVMNAAYPVAHAEFENRKADHDMRFLIEVIKAVRNIRMEVNAPLSSKIDLLIQLDDVKNKSILTQNEHYVEHFLHPKKLQVETKIEAPKLSKTAIIPGAQIFVPLSELVDLDQELVKMMKEKTRLEGEVSRAQNKLNNSGFIAHAPQAVIDKQKAKLSDYQSQLDGLKTRITELKASK